MTTMEIEIAAARWFKHRENIIVPNVWWGLGLPYEADLVVLRPSGFAVEVEIKTNATDLKADRKKRHQHDSRLFAELWFAVPAGLSGCPDIPERAGVLELSQGKPTCRLIRKAKRYRHAIRWSDQQRLKLLHLGCMRIWGLKTARLQQLRRIAGQQLMCHAYKE